MVGGTSRISREAYVRFCERLGVKFRGPTRQAKWWTHKAESTDAGRGTEQPVVVMKSAKSRRSEGVASSSLGYGPTV